MATKDWNPVVLVGGQPELYRKIVLAIAKEAGYDPATDVTIVPYIQAKVRTDVNNFRTAWKYGKWVKEGAKFVLKPPPNHPYSKVEGAEGLEITENTEKAKIAAFKAAGIETLALPRGWEEGKGTLAETRKYLGSLSVMIVLALRYHFKSVITPVCLYHTISL